MEARTMNANHRQFFEREDWKPLKKALTGGELVPQYELLSRIGLPAVQAAVWTIEPAVEGLDEKTRNFAIQSSGALIGDVLTQRGFRIARDARGAKRRGQVRKSRFIRTGTIFEEPEGAITVEDQRVREIMDKLMVRYRTTLEALAK
jgi:hypothetical protein